MNPSQSAENISVSEQAFYTTHSAVSDPGPYGSLLEALPVSFPALSKTMQGLLFHYMAGPYQHGYQPSSERLKEIDSRRVERMIQRLLELDSRPLTEPRAFENRLVGCCRDFSLLTCAVLRQRHIAARPRYGFASYFVSGYWFDHVIVEAWNGTTWQRFDPQVTDGVDKMSLSEDEFLTGGRAHQLWRKGDVNPDLFGLGPREPEIRGGWFIRSRLMLDLAALNKQEMLCWDQWGFEGSRADLLTPEADAVLDRAALLTEEGDTVAVRQLLANNPDLQVPETVACYSPAVGLHTVRV